MKDELLHDLKRCIVNLKTKVDLLSSPHADIASLRVSQEESTNTDENLLLDFGTDSISNPTSPPGTCASEPLVETTVTNINTQPYPKPQKQQIIKDNEPELKKLCIMIEKVFRRGLKQQSSVFGVTKKDYWCWLELLAESKANKNPHFSMIVNKIKSSAKFLSAQGRGRCFIRAALNKKILHAPIEMLYRNHELLISIYDPLISLFTNEDSREFILGIFSLLSAINFDLKIRNASFLDETWELPVFKQMELVPSDDLGLTIRYVQSRAVVVDTDPYGVAAEDSKVEIGDTIDEVHQISVYDAKPLVIQQILQDHHGWPITIGVIKPKLTDKTFFQPIEKRLLEISNIYPTIKRLIDSLQEDSDGSQTRDTTVCIEGKQYWFCTYIGEYDVGARGGSQLIEPTIQTMLKSRDKNKDRLVLLASYEADVTVLDRETKEHVWTHSFPEISSCGRRVDHLKCFAYIVGNNICNVADSFVCHLFEAPTADVSRDILQNIAQGFKRTTWLT